MAAPRSGEQRVKYGFKVACALLLAVALAAPAHAAELRVAAAASTQEALTAIARDFAKRTGDTVRFSFGSSGKLSQQISQGAPFDVFFSADVAYARRLVTAGHAAEPRPYARGRLVLWSLKRSGLDVRRGLTLLASPAVRKVAIANPKVAPYGRAAVEALTHAGLHDAVAPRFVRGENIAQAAQFVESGGAEAGLLSLSLAVSPRLAPRGTSWLVPAAWHAPLDAEAAVVTGSAEPALARRFLAYATGPAAAPIWRRYGLEPIR